MDAVVRRPVAQAAQPELAHERQVLLPVPVVEGLLQLVDAHAAAGRRRIGRVAALDAGGEHELA